MALSNVDPTGESTIAIGAEIGLATGGPVGAAIGSAIGLGLGYIIYESCKDNDKSCPPCKLLDGTIVPIGQIAYRFDQVPPSKPHYPFTGDHVHLFKANQNPKNCQCFWKEIDTVAPPPPSGAIEVQPFLI